jgi:hypothetical protein
LLCERYSCSLPFFSSCKLCFWFYSFSRFCGHSDRPSFGCILSQFYGRGFADRFYRTMTARVRCIHLAPRTFVLYNSTPHSSNSQPCLCLHEFVYPTYLSILSRVFKVWRVDAFPGSENLKAFVAPLHPRYLPPFPIDINYAFKSHNRPDRFEKIGFNKLESSRTSPIKMNRQANIMGSGNFFCLHFEFAKKKKKKLALFGFSF